MNGMITAKEGVPSSSKYSVISARVLSSNAKSEKKTTISQAKEPANPFAYNFLAVLKKVFP
jgi:hypothetical protein